MNESDPEMNGFERELGSLRLREAPAFRGGRPPLRLSVLIGGLAFLALAAYVASQFVTTIDAPPGSPPVHVVHDVPDRPEPKPRIEPREPKDAPAAPTLLSLHLRAADTKKLMAYLDAPPAELAPGRRADLSALLQLLTKGGKLP